MVVHRIYDLTVVSALGNFVVRIQKLETEERTAIQVDCCWRTTGWDLPGQQIQSGNQSCRDSWFGNQLC